MRLHHSVIAWRFAPPWCSPPLFSSLPSANYTPFHIVLPDLLSKCTFKSLCEPPAHFVFLHSSGHCHDIQPIARLHSPTGYEPRELQQIHNRRQTQIPRNWSNKPMQAYSCRCLIPDTRAPLSSRTYTTQLLKCRKRRGWTA